METYSNVHRLFLQACANHGTLAVPQALKILNQIFCSYNNDSDASESDMREIIADINEQIKKFDQEIKTVKHELIGQQFIVFSNTAEVDVNRFQSHYSQSDCNYFRLVLNEIADSENSCIRPITALNLSNKLNTKTFTKSHAEDLLQEWSELGYFLEKDDLIHFGPKVIAEFGNYLKTQYADNVNVCVLCRQVTFWPVRCENCSQALHRDCIRKYLTKMSKCPKCKSVWSTRLD